MTAAIGKNYIDSIPVEGWYFALRTKLFCCLHLASSVHASKSKQIVYPAHLYVAGTYLMAGDGGSNHVCKHISIA